MQTPTMSSLLENAASWICLPPSGITSDLLSWVIWKIWIIRNMLLFESRPASAQATASRAITGAREWLQAQDPKTPTPKNTQITGGPPPIPLGTVSCNTDAAWKKESKDAGLAWIFDASSSPLPMATADGCQFQSKVSSAIMAEGLAIQEALSHAHSIGITKIWLRSDSLSLVKAINSISKSMNLYGVLLDIDVLSSAFFFCCVSFISREENGPADMLAKACLFHSITSWT